MTKDRKIIRKLLDVCLSLELDVQAAYAVLSAIRRANPQLPIQEAINEIHQKSELRQSVLDRYQILRDNLEREELEELLSGLPESKWKN